MISALYVCVKQIIVIAYYTLLSTIELILLLIILKLFLPNSISSATVVILASLTIWITSLAYIPIGLFFAERFGTVISVIVSVIGIVLGVVMAPESYWMYIPWSWGMRLMSPIVGVHPKQESFGERKSFIGSFRYSNRNCCLHCHFCFIIFCYSILVFEKRGELKCLFCRFCLPNG